MYSRILFIILLITLGGCSSVDIREYQNNTPQFDLFTYFSGKTTGYGIVQDRKGKVTRQFTVDITGTIQNNDQLTLHEEFDWSDGEQSERTWVLTKHSPHHVTGVAGDVVNTANGLLYGNALNWQYQLNVEVDDSTWKIRFDDWMFLVTEKILINRATMSKFGLTVGEVTIVFQKDA
jgi:hypothetical protein